MCGKNPQKSFELKMSGVENQHFHPLSPSTVTHTVSLFPMVLKSPLLHYAISIASEDY